MGCSVPPHFQDVGVPDNASGCDTREVPGQEAGDIGLCWS